MTLRLLQVASTLKEGAGHVTAAATKVSTSSQSLADGSNAQAASLEETSASLEEMAGMTKPLVGTAIQTAKEFAQTVSLVTIDKAIPDSNLVTVVW